MVGNVILPWTFSSFLSSFWKLPLVLAVLFILFTLANFGVDSLLLYYDLIGKKMEIFLDRSYISRISFRFVYILCMVMAYYFVNRFIKQKNISIALEKQKFEMMIEEERTRRALAKAHNDFLKAQINPHFLFNTLNFVYHNISVHAPEAADAVLTLSEMMRYAVDSSEQEEFIILGEEMEQVEKLIHLYELRKSETLNLILNFDSDAAKLRFVPLVLMTLVENIFKHGDTTEAETGIQIVVTIEGDRLLIETLNAIGSSHKQNSSRAGLKNIEERLNFAYGEAATCSFTKVEGVFCARITVLLAALNLKPKVLIAQ